IFHTGRKPHVDAPAPTIPPDRRRRPRRVESARGRTPPLSLHGCLYAVVSTRSFSICAVAAENGSNRATQDGQVEHEGPVLDVPQVGPYRFVPGQIAASADLAQSRQPRFDEQPPRRAVLSVPGDLAFERWSRADERHVALDHVEQLRQFVER